MKPNLCLVLQGLCLVFTPASMPLASLLWQWWFSKACVVPCLHTTEQTGATSNHMQFTALSHIPALLYRGRRKLRHQHCRHHCRGGGGRRCVVCHCRHHPLLLHGPHSHHGSCCCCQGCWGCPQANTHAPHQGARCSVHLRRWVAKLCPDLCQG